MGVFPSVLVAAVCQSCVTKTSKFCQYLQTCESKCFVPVMVVNITDLCHFRPLTAALTLFKCHKVSSRKQLIF